MFYLVKCEFINRLSVNSYTTDNSGAYIHSDTLFSALMSQWALVPSKAGLKFSVDNLINRFQNTDPPFLLSSLFPYQNEDYYLPTPLGTSTVFSDELKNIPLLKLADFIELLKNAEISGKVNVDRIVFDQSIPHASIDRLSFGANLFFTDEKYFKSGSGLYFLLKINDKDIQNDLFQIIKLLAEHGIGADRTTGSGTFIPTIISIANEQAWTSLLSPKDDVTNWIALSLVHPSPQEATAAISYEIITREGWALPFDINLPTRRKKCHMFSEGSIFSSPINGNLALVKKAQPHNIYRYGIGFHVGTS